jgi:hypothetical protein
LNHLVGAELVSAVGARATFSLSIIDWFEMSLKNLLGPMSSYTERKAA